MKRRKISAENKAILNAAKKFDKKQENHWKKQGLLNKEVAEAIHDMCTAMGGEVVVDNDIDDSPIITYDGGRHAEYNSTICAVVTAIRAKEKNGFKTFQVDLEECEEYDSDRINFEDACQIFDFVYYKFDEWLGDPEGEDEPDFDEIGEQD